LVWSVLGFKFDFAKMKSKKIINDPLYGFITVRSGLILRLISHPYFQRLRRIKQLGLTEWVYPGANHTRFHHALGAMHLMDKALQVLEGKGHKISDKERKSAMAAILLHDIGHGPFSHALETTILSEAPHEEISLLLMKSLNKELGAKLDVAIAMFEGNYPRPFFHQLISSQLDMDRMDYLMRDCYFTGVVEGKVGTERIISMMDLENENIVVEEKAIYSVENFLNARRLMYWQVYLHKTTTSTEQMLIQLIRRARELAISGEDIFALPNFKLFLENHIKIDDFASNPSYLEAFARIDDYDIWACIKAWSQCSDTVLSALSQMFLNRQIFRVEFSSEPIDPDKIMKIKEAISVHYRLDEDKASYLMNSGSVTNAGYNSNVEQIMIKMKDGRLLDVAQASDLPNIKALSKIVRKHYLCYPKNLGQVF
jgi:HD superfamily phosphohydrolase